MSDYAIDLRPLTSQDSPVLFSWINNRAEVLFNGSYKPIHQARHQDWFESVQRRDDLALFGIHHIQTNELVGTCQLHSINSVSRSAELQIRLGDVGERGKGLGTQAVRLLISFGFRDLNLHRIYLNVFSSNARAIHVYEKVGFVREGLLRQAAYLDGAYEDVVVMGLLRDDYLGS